MKTSAVNKASIIQALRKAVEDKKDVSRYVRGEITRADLERKGIKLAKPL